MKCIMREKRPRKSPGMDNVKKIALKYIPYKGILFFSCIINSCIKLQYFSQMWKLAKIFLISKTSKPPNDANNYRRYFEQSLQLPK